MKTLISILLVLAFTSLQAQAFDEAKPFSNNKIGVLAGVNITELPGALVIFERKTNLTKELFAKISLGYSVINKKEGYTVKTYSFISFDDHHQYATASYKIDEINYDVIPLSLGFEYIFMKGAFSPYGLIEGGYNFYSYHTQNSKHIVGEHGYFDSFEELPAEYQNKAPEISEGNSYRIAVGAGTNYKLSSAINLDIRYVCQFNKILINDSQLLIGINF